MPSYTAYKRQVMDADDNITWITMNGNHIPIKEGQTKEEAVKEFLASKGKSGEGSAKHGSGEYKAKSEHLGGRINTNIDPNREKAGKTKYDPSDDFATQLYKHKKDTQSKGEGSAKHGSGEYKAKSEKNDESFNYRLLDRLRTDNEYYLGNGGRNDKHLWAGNPKDQIAKMRELYKGLSKKPEWLTEEKINEYEEKMVGKKEGGSFPQSFSEPKKASGLRSAFGKHYDKLYNDRDLDDKSGYLLDEWDKHIKDPKFKKAVQEFVEERGDFISSDREVKAFMLAAKETGLIPQEKKTKAKSKSDSPLVKAVAKALGKSESEAESEIEGAAQYIHDLMKSNDLRNGDVEETLRGLGIEPDYAEEFMQWASAPKKKASKKTKEPAIVRQGGVNYVDPKAWNSPASDPWYSLYE